eukprot:CAMPEP_0181262702 /NCGR_PEP_ID=MMETSP1097-20121128/2179_1 /TAXON_ID=35684 /ORGANISM="Pseudopedinella elastica, Strain CCMP716" /LENGTH=164 /DNA_ID=CAMNT_0023361423 /DNA_START=90 /DNA_END=580 /DNA_ORIENTATION=-
MARSHWPQFRWLSRIWEENMRLGKLDNFLEAQGVITDLLLMAEGDAFVGKFTSNLDRIAYSLMCARRGGLAPYYSLDGSAWCADWGQLAGKSDYGGLQVLMSKCPDIDFDIRQKRDVRSSGAEMQLVARSMSAEKAPARMPIGLAVKQRRAADARAVLELVRRA